MDINYFDLSGGINQSTTKTELGAHSGKLYWSDSENVELYNNKGIIRQNGNTLLFELPQQQVVSAICAMEADGLYKLVITTGSGNIYVYDVQDNELTTVNKTISGVNVIMTPFLRGMIVATESDSMFYIKNDANYTVVGCNLKDQSNNVIYPDYVTVYKGRVWCSKGSTIYYSALGTYNDFSTQNDAGYINDFHTDTADIVTMCNYKDYLAIYKKERVYLLTGSNPDDFSITLFADKGAYAKNGIVNVDNKQYFISAGIYALEQVGELNQIRLGSEISTKIKKEFEKFDISKMNSSFIVHYPTRQQMWFFIPYSGSEFFHTIWINDYLNHAWYKRVLPQNIVKACFVKDFIISADNQGKFYREDSGNTFNNIPISFMWKSPFLALGNVMHRKLVDEFYFILDDIKDNNFKFSLYKDYDGEYPEDADVIFSRHYSHFMWAGEDTADLEQYKWATDDSQIPVWPVSTDVMEKAEICGSNLSVQLCVQGNEIVQNCAILGLQFREIYNDD